MMDYKKVSAGRIFWAKPPRLDTRGFDEKALKLLAKAKITELRKQRKNKDSRLEQLERKNERLISNNLAVQLKHKVEIYRTIEELHYINLWINHWKKIGNLFSKLKNKSSFSDKEVQRAREYPLENLLGSTKSVGSRITTKCPFHNKEREKEKSQSFFVYENGSYHCFSCQAHGANAIDFLIQTENLDFRQAVERLL